MVWLLLACGAPSIELSDRLVPLEALRVDPVDEVGVDWALGEDDDGYWAHGHARVNWTLPVVWDALTQTDVVADRRSVARYTREDLVLADMEPAFALDNEVEDILNIEYRMLWRHQLQVGTPSRPDTVVIHFAKTEGTVFIQRLEGTLELQADGDQTEITLMERMEAPARDEQTLQTYLQDVLNDVEATAAGQPLPEFDTP